MSKHTPGPWVAVARTNAYMEIEAPNEHGYVAKKVASLSMPNHIANARLIAAAPELLGALQLAVRQNGHDMLMTGEELRKCEAAIAKATGETQ